MEGKIKCITTTKEKKKSTLYNLCKRRRNKLDKEVKNGTPRHLKYWMICELNDLEKKLNQPE